MIFILCGVNKDSTDTFNRALEIMRLIDEKDSAFLAVGILLELYGIWTEDNDFRKQDVLKVYSTKDLLEFMNID